MGNSWRVLFRTKRLVGTLTTTTTTPARETTATTSTAPGAREKWRPWRSTNFAAWASRTTQRSEVRIYGSDAASWHGVGGRGVWSLLNWKTIRPCRHVGRVFRFDRVSPDKAENAARSETSIGFHTSDFNQFVSHRLQHQLSYCS